MLFGVCSNIKNVVYNSFVNGQAGWDFDVQGAKESRIQEIFYRLGWNKLYAKSAWWDVFGWDRAVRMQRVKRAIRDVMTAKKIESLPALRIAAGEQATLESLKGQFRFFKRKELAALMMPRHELHAANASGWKRAKRRAPAGCSAPTVWHELMKAPKEEIARLSRLIQGDLDPKTISRLPKKDRNLLLGIAHLHSDFTDRDRSPLPSRMQLLFNACDHSDLILFGLQRRLRSERPFFEEKLKETILPQLKNLSQSPLEMEDGGRPVLKKLRQLAEGGHLFRGRTFTIVKHGGRSPEVVPIAPNLPSLVAHLDRLSVHQNESFTRAIQTLLLDEATVPPNGARPGGLLWQMHALTGPLLGEDRLISHEFGKGALHVEIHDFGQGRIQVRYIAEERTQQNPCGLPGRHLGSSRLPFSYTIQKEEQTGAYQIADFSLGNPTFEWEPRNNHPFTAPHGWPDLKAAYAEAIQEE